MNIGDDRRSRRRKELFLTNLPNVLMERTVFGGTLFAMPLSFFSLVSQ